jgi:hypothetical protein
MTDKKQKGSGIEQLEAFCAETDPSRKGTRPAVLHKKKTTSKPGTSIIIRELPDKASRHTAKADDAQRMARIPIDQVLKNNTPPLYVHQDALPCYASKCFNGA